jgi:c(7)-type cytochrome triheme protein
MNPRRPFDPRLALLVVLAMAALGCRSAAGVILDLPEPIPDPAPAAESQTMQGPRPTGAQNGGIWVDTITAPPEIESVAAESVLARLPRHSSGQIDWGAALESGTISPRSELPGELPAGVPADFGYDFYFGEVETAFPHSTHSDWLACQSCHPAVYRRREGSRTTMAMMQDGESCGLCHGGVAFKADACERCHPDLQLPPGRIQASLEVDVVIPRDSTAGMTTDDFPPSIFPHWTHRIRYRCAACHPSTFVMREGGTAITMSAMQRGETCGTCHNGETAFGVMECGVCHRPAPEPIILPDSAATG